MAEDRSHIGILCGYLCFYAMSLWPGSSSFSFISFSGIQRGPGTEKFKSDSLRDQGRLGSEAYTRGTYASVSIPAHVTRRLEK